MRFSRAALAVLVACSSSKAPSGAPPSSPPPVSPAPTAETVTAAPAAASTPSTRAADPREAQLAITVAHLLEKEHLLHKRIDDEVSRAAFATYLDRLDGGKMFLLASDRKALDRFADQIDDELHSGSLDLAHEGERVFVARVDVVDKIVQDVLAQPMKFDKEEWYETDPKKTEPAKTEDDLRDRWRKRLQLEVLERVGGMEKRLDKQKQLDKEKKTGAGAGSGSAAAAPSNEDKAMPIAEIPPTDEGREAKARNDLAKAYSGRFARLRHPEPLDAATDLLNSVTSTLDPHTDYLPPADKANFDIQMTGSLEGIGASLRERDHYIEVVELVPGGAAWRQGGLAPNDLILAVQQEGKDAIDVVDMRLDDVVKMIRGPKNTTVRIRVQKPDGHEETLAIKRDVIVIEESYARGAVLTRGGKTYGYIHLPQFYGGPNGARTASDDVHKLLVDLRKKKVAGIILDIRSNGGGLLQDCVTLTGEMIDHGPVVQVRDSAGHKEVLEDEQRGTDYDGPLIVMVDRFSASASEILAGALQDYHRAVIVGTGPTHGKGTVQKLVDLDRVSGSRRDLGDLKITTEQFFRVSGSSTQLEGVVPDIVLPDPAGYMDTGERKLDHPIAWSQIDSAPHDDWRATWKVQALQQKSMARTAKDPRLSKIAAANQLLRQQREDSRMPLEKKAWTARRKTLEAALDQAAPDTTKLSPLFTVAPLDEAAGAAPAPPGPGVKPNDRPAKWRDALARDPWVDETLAVLGDMAGR
jgi:carboxyl-terminal processing protease